MHGAQNTKSENKPLSSRAIDAMKPGDKIKADTGENSGLRVKCGKTAIKTFFYRYTSPVTKKLVQIKIGHFPEVPLTEARSKLHKLKSIRKSGLCPKTEADQQKQEDKQLLDKQQAEQSFTVHELVDLYLTEYIDDKIVNGKRVAGARKPKGQAEVRSTLYRDAVTVLGNLSAAKINRRHIVDVVMGVVKRGSNVQAGNLLREISAAYEYAIGLDYFDDEFANPAILAKSSLRQAKIRLTSKRGKRVLSDNELVKLLKWLPGSVFTPTQKHILKFTLWTGCRTGEVCGAVWKDIDLNNATWHLKATKTNVERYVQLSRQAVAFLEYLKSETGDYLFPSQKTAKPIQQKSLTEQAWHLRTTERMIDIDHWTPHDLRRTVRTGLSRIKCPSEIAEAVLGHARGGIEGTYDLHGYEEECREWLQKWADYMDRLMKDDVGGIEPAL